MPAQNDSPAIQTNRIGSLMPEKIEYQIEPFQRFRLLRITMDSRGKERRENVGEFSSEARAKAFQDGLVVSEMPDMPEETAA